ncbi:MAG: efflux RND transporter periplasmic adaptor subunit [Chitinophagales bacterium]
MNKTIYFLLLLLVVFSSCHSKEKKHEEVIQLPITTPLLTDTAITKEYVCQIHAIKHIELRALEKGYLQKIYVDEGQLVPQGKMMFKIMPNVYEADLQKAKAEARLAETEYKNTKALADSNVVSPNELALAKSTLDKANAEVQLASTHLGFTDVKAPFTGIMDRLQVREGSLLDEGELLTTLSDNSQMWVYFNVPEAEYLNYVATHKNAEKEPVSLMLANGDLFNQKGVIETIEGEFNNETGNIEFRAGFPNPDRILRHGQTGSILINTPYKNALIIPQKATFEVLDKKYVFVVNEENKLEQREISIAYELPNIFIIKDGLSKNDKILLDGLRKVKDGEEVTTTFLKPEEVLSNLHLDAE